MDRSWRLWSALAPQDPHLNDDVGCRAQHPIVRVRDPSCRFGARIPLSVSHLHGRLNRVSFLSPISGVWVLPFFRPFQTLYSKAALKQLPGAGAFTADFQLSGFTIYHKTELLSSPYLAFCTRISVFLYTKRTPPQTRCLAGADEAPRL